MAPNANTVITKPRREDVKATIAPKLVKSKNPIAPIMAAKKIVPVTPSGLLQNDLGLVLILSTLEKSVITKL